MKFEYGLAIEWSPKNVIKFVKCDHCSFIFLEIYVFENIF